jgi:elongation factor Ts
VVQISLDQIKELRERSGAGVMDCKRALEASGGDLDKAVKHLAEQGIAMAEKKSNRVTAQGLIDCYIHAGRIGAIVEVNCETDFVARTPDFKTLVREIAIQVVAANPSVISEEELKEGADGPPEQLALLAQPYMRDPTRNIRQLINETIGRTGENIQVKRFSRFELGS